MEIENVLNAPQAEAIPYIDASSQPEEQNRLDIIEEPPLCNDFRETGIGTSPNLLLFIKMHAQFY